MGSAEAANCAAGATCNVLLTNTNVTGVQITINVTINNTGATTILTFAFVSDNITNNPLGLDQIGWTADVNANPVPVGWTQKTDQQMDGFGKFARELDQPAGTNLTQSFTLASLVTSFPDNAAGAEFAVHIRYDGNCSAFVSDGTTSPSPDAGCNIITSPEPSSLPLLGVGLIAIGLGWRKISRFAAMRS
jgi:hypothetical protein